MAEGLRRWLLRGSVSMWKCEEVFARQVWSGSMLCSVQRSSATKSLAVHLHFLVMYGRSITILFAGSKKSLATGVPMAQVLFATSAVGMIILPLMLFHQIQLMVCTVLAQRYARRPELPEQTAVQ